MSEIKIIALYGSQGAGKTTIAKEIERCFGYERRSFAGPIRQCLRTMGVPIDADTPDNKGKPIDGWNGQSFRSMAQELGTMGRIWRPSVWVDATLGDLRDKPVTVVIDDLRYSNEYRALKDLGAWIVRVQNLAADLKFDDNHESEKDWRYSKFIPDEVLTNNDFERIPIPAHLKKVPNSI